MELKPCKSCKNCFSFRCKRKLIIPKKEVKYNCPFWMNKISAIHLVQENRKRKIGDVQNIFQKRW
jgi:hypothetical protein